MKKIFITILSLSVLISANVLGSQVKVVVDGTTLSSSGTIVDERTLVPIREVSEALGATVDWNSESQRVKLSRPNVTINMDGSVSYRNMDITMVIGEKTIIVDGEKFDIDVPTQIVGNKTMVPLREVGEWFGCEVEWDDATKTVNIKKGLNDSLSNAKLQKVQTELAERDAINNLTGPATFVVYVESSQLLNDYVTFVHGDDATDKGKETGIYEYSSTMGSAGDLIYSLLGYDENYIGEQIVNGIRINNTAEGVYFCEQDLVKNNIIK